MKNPRRLLRQRAEAHALECREALAAGHRRRNCRDDFSNVDLSRANLAGGHFYEAVFQEAKLKRANLAGANLTKAWLPDSYCYGADFSDAVLFKAGFEGAVLVGAKFVRADLRGVELYEVTLHGADFTDALLDEGVAVGRVAEGNAGGFHWWAVRLRDGGAVLSFHWYRYTLDWWREQSPMLCRDYGYDVEHWSTGPAVALAAAEALVRGALAPGR